LLVSIDTRSNRSEQKRPVAAQRPTEGRPGLEMAVRCLPFRHVEGVPTAQAVVAQEQKRRAARGIGAGAGDDVDDAARRFAELGREPVRQHLELLHGVLTEDRTHAADRLVVVVEAVHDDVVRARSLAGERQARGARGSLLRCPIGRGRRRHQREGEVVAHVHRQPLELGPLDDAADAGLPGIVQRALGEHVHVERDAGELQADRDVHGRPKRQHDVRNDEGREAGQLRLEPVGAHWQREDREPAILTRMDRTQEARLLVGCDDHRARKHRVRRVRDRAEEIGASGLETSGERERRSETEREDNEAEHPGGRTP
jgi:hypothetical protein